MWPGIYPRVYHSLTLMFNFGYYCRELNISLKKKIGGNTHLFHASRGRHLTFKPKLYSNYVIVQRTVITEITGSKQTMRDLCRLGRFFEEGCNQHTESETVLHTYIRVQHWKICSFSLQAISNSFLLLLLKGPSKGIASKMLTFQELTSFAQIMFCLLLCIWNTDQLVN